MLVRTSTTDSLAAAWAALKETAPQLRIRDAARRLSVSEAHLLSLGLESRVQALKPEWEALLASVPALGTVMALTRNEAVVIEKDGTYGKPEFFKHPGAHIGQVLGPDIDLRIFLHEWAFGFAVQTETERGTQRSLQFFDAYGEAVHKIFLRPASDVAQYEQLVDTFTLHEPVDYATAFRPETERPVEQRNATPDAEGFLKGWSELADTHQFFGLVRKHGLTRLQAVELALGKYSREVATAEAINTVLTQAAETSLSIMVFVGNPGCIEIHTGPVRTIKRMDTWNNVLDKGFNLHINETLLGRAFIVEKPTTDGVVTSLEVFDQSEKLAVQFFGERKPGKPELEPWRKLVQELK
jgi:putative hemin transport protein